MEKAEPSLDFLTVHTHLSLTHLAIMPAQIYKIIPLIPSTLTVHFRLSSFITGILILVFPPPLIWLSSVVFLCCAITQIQKLAPAATALSLGKTRTNMKAIWWENGIAGSKVPSSRKGWGARCVTDLAECLLISFSSNQLSLVVPVTRKVNAQSHSLILVHKSDAAIACKRSQLGDNLAVQAPGFVKLFTCKSNYLMPCYLLLAFFLAFAVLYPIAWWNACFYMPFL